MGGRQLNGAPQAGYLESLPVGPNDGDGVLPPGLLLQPPQLPASLHTQGGREETESRKPMKQGKVCGGRGRHRFFFFLVACGQQTSHTQTHCTALHSNSSRPPPWRGFESRLRKNKTMENCRKENRVKNSGGSGGSGGSGDPDG